MRERESERGRKRKGVRVRERKKGREGIEGEGEGGDSNFYYDKRITVLGRGKQDRSRQCQYIQSIDNFFFFLRKILILSAKYCQIRYLRVRINENSFTCSILKKFKILFFLRPFCHFFVNAVSHNFQSYQPILLILNSKQRVRSIKHIENKVNTMSKEHVLLCSRVFHIKMWSNQILKLYHTLLWTKRKCLFFHFVLLFVVVAFPICGVACGPVKCFSHCSGFSDKTWPWPLTFDLWLLTLTLDHDLWRKF